MQMIEKDSPGGRSVNLVFSKKVVGGYDVQWFKRVMGDLVSWYVAQAGVKRAIRRKCGAQSHMKLPPSFHYFEQSTWSEATKELILGTKPNPVN